MAKNDFLPFGLADGANVLSNEEYNKLAARTNGFSSGVAKSQELNKVWRQASVIASVVAQFIAETTGNDVLDDGNLATLQNGLLNALRATVSSTVPSASVTTAGITRLSNDTDSNADNVAATSRAVKMVADSRLEKSRNGADIPNKSEFVKNLGLADAVKRAENAKFVVERGRNALGTWVIWSDGAIELFGLGSPIAGLAAVRFPIELPSTSYYISIAERIAYDTTENVAHISMVIDRTLTRSGFNARCQVSNGGASGSSFSWRIYYAPF
ncbi:tail fiber protein [Xenorhabdus eapokensis]|uniref:Tail fiber protein n=1 Tax=Xenorhabdus eapokensis TaxID=1873482 RepID=A0A1Q5TQZ1_9GAMM|nr:tail fiber protein [Xenorhabdus eapokensis]OKP02630.1 putative protein StfE [Xenorhabdus eapokensis]